jgi:hypothetical protein
MWRKKEKKNKKGQNWVLLRMKLLSKGLNGVNWMIEINASYFLVL